MKKALLIIATAIATGCTVIPESQFVAKVATERATHHVINNGAMPADLASYTVPDATCTAANLSGCLPTSDLALELDSEFKRMSRRSLSGQYGVSVPGRLFPGDTVDSSLIAQWVRETAGGR